MLALRKTEAVPGVVLTETAVPRPAGDEVIVAVEAAGICGTDLHIADWTGGYEAMTSAMPVTLGHEFAGRVVGGAGIRSGQRIVVRPSVVCGTCPSCLGGRFERCTSRTGIGIRRDGGFASRVVVPAVNCIAVPDGLDAEIAALTEPMTVAAEAADRAMIRPGARVLILGPGPIGLGVALFVEASGATDIVLAGRDDAARFACAHALGFPATIDVGDRPLAEALRTGGQDRAFDVVIEAAGVAALIPQALDVLDQDGLLVVVGIHARPASLDLTRLVRAGQTIRGSYRAPIATWSRVVDRLSAEPERFRRLITHRLPLSEALDGLAAMRDRSGVKVMLDPQMDMVAT
ncbi:alcohol dehydrogenase [Phreatobacter stygius]|uniref:Alcohol dehydrogenase n=2 Tax=Phreatobacter stygius TaxID=1940610 RepID=A0A4D7B854_9HYPH|nr:alcohol dehydrogenase [Phreatobacter stygius]